MQAYLSNQATSTHGRTPSNPYTSKDRDTSPDEAVIFDDDTLPSACAASPIPPSGIRRHRSRVEAHIGPDNDVVPDGDFAGVYDGAVLANDRVLADLDVVPVVAGKRSLYHYVFADAACVCDGRGLSWGKLDGIFGMEDFPEQARTLTGRDTVVRVRAVVEPPARGAASLSFKHQFLLEGIKRSPGEHFFFFTATAATRTGRWKL